MLWYYNSNNLFCCLESVKKDTLWARLFFHAWGIAESFNITRKVCLLVIHSQAGSSCIDNAFLWWWIIIILFLKVQEFAPKKHLLKCPDAIWKHIWYRYLCLWICDQIWSICEAKLHRICITMLWLYLIYYICLVKYLLSAF